MYAQKLASKVILEPAKLEILTKHSVLASYPLL